jgi:hypothetical protein
VALHETSGDFHCYRTWNFVNLHIHLNGTRPHQKKNSFSKISIPFLTNCRISSDGKMHNQIVHVLIDRKRRSSILDVWSFRGADCDTDHCLVGAKVRERLAVSKRPVNKIDRFNLKKLNEGEVKEQYQVKIKNRFSALENLRQ